MRFRKLFSAPSPLSLLQVIVDFRKNQHPPRKTLWSLCAPPSALGSLLITLFQMWNSSWFVVQLTCMSLTRIPLFTTKVK